MQEEIEMRVVTMMFNATKFSGRTLKSGVSQLIQKPTNAGKNATLCPMASRPSNSLHGRIRA